MLGLWAVGRSPPGLRLHIAFRTELAQVRESVALLRARGIVARSRGGGPEIDEPVVIPWMPAASLYFDDPDGHALEHFAILPQPARPEMTGRVTLSAWETTR